MKGQPAPKDSNLESPDWYNREYLQAEYLLAINLVRWESHVKQNSSGMTVWSDSLFRDLLLQAEIMSLSFYIINFNYPHKCSFCFRQQWGKAETGKNSFNLFGTWSVRWDLCLSHKPPQPQRHTTATKKHICTRAHRHAHTGKQAHMHTHTSLLNPHTYSKSLKWRCTSMHKA